MKFKLNGIAWKNLFYSKILILIIEKNILLLLFFCKWLIIYVYIIFLFSSQYISDSLDTITRYQTLSVLFQDSFNRNKKKKKSCHWSRFLFHPDIPIGHRDKDKDPKCPQCLRRCKDYEWARWIHWPIFLYPSTTRACRLSAVGMDASERSV